MHKHLKHLCDCGRPAFKRVGNDYVCARCAKIEKEFYKYHTIKDRCEADHQLTGHEQNYQG